MWNKPAKKGCFEHSYETASTPPRITGGDQEGLSANINDREPEKSRTIELVTKWKVLNERLNRTAALFQTERHDAQIEVAPDVVEQAGETRVRGLELGISGQVMTGWTMSGGYTNMHREHITGPYGSST